MLTSEKWFKKKLTAILAVIISVLTMITCYFNYDSSESYMALPQQVLLDIYNRPIGSQDLLGETSHNPKYRKDTGNGETASDFAKEALLTLFRYDKRDLVSGNQLSKFKLWMDPEIGEEIYTEIFVNLSQQRIVMAQDGYVRSRIIGPLEYIGAAEREYVSRSGLGIKANTHKFVGKMIVTAYGDDEYPTIYNNVSVIVQRALLQDKINGYQLVSMELN